MLLCQQNIFYTHRVCNPISMWLFPFPFPLVAQKQLPFPWYANGNPTATEIPIPTHTSRVKYIAAYRQDDPEASAWIHQSVTVWLTLSTLSRVLADVSTYATFHWRAQFWAVSTDTCRLASKSILFPTKMNGTNSSFFTRTICSLAAMHTRLVTDRHHQPYTILNNCYYQSRNQKFISGCFLPPLSLLPLSPLFPPRSGPLNAAKGFGGTLSALPSGAERQLQPSDMFLWL